MPTKICIFEDEAYGNFLPLVYTRPVYDLKCGVMSLKERLQNSFPKSQFVLQCRDYLADYVSLRNPTSAVNRLPGEKCLFLNGRILETRDIARLIPKESKEDQIYVNNGHVVGARLSGTKLGAMEQHLRHPILTSHFGDIERIEVDINLVTYPWDLVHRNWEMLLHDGEAILARNGRRPGKGWKGVDIIRPKSVLVGKGSTVMPGTVLDATGGPIIIGDQVKVFPNASIVGPAYIGHKSEVKIGASIYENCSIGTWCKVGGEIECSIVHGYSNKQHSGFLGHSYVGKWVNLGADTNASNLKNNYGNVRVTIGGRQIDSGLIFVGLFMGDHSKSAINTMFNTGSVVGVSCNVAMAGFPLKSIPSFAWVTGEGHMETYDIQRALKTAKTVLARRQVEFSPVEEELFRKVYDLTREERAYPDIDG